MRGVYNNCLLNSRAGTTFRPMPIAVSSLHSLPAMASVHLTCLHIQAYPLANLAEVGLTEKRDTYAPKSVCSVPPPFVQ